MLRKEGKVTSDGPNRSNQIAFFIVVVIFTIVVSVFFSVMKSSPEGQVTKNVPPVVFESAQPVKTGPAAREYRKDTLLVEFKPGVSDAKKEGKFKKLGVAVVKTIAGKVKKIRVKEQDLTAVEAELMKDTDVNFVERDYSVQLAVLPNDPYVPSEYHLALMHYPDAWNISTGNAEVRVAAPDTGVLTTHQDLQNMLLMALAFNTVDNSNSVSDVQGHGTLTSGLVGADTNNGAGVASGTWLKKIIPLRITNDGQSFYYSDIAEAVTYAADNGARVVSLSLTVQDSSTVRSAASYLNSKNGLLFVAAGNGGTLSSYQSGGNWPEMVMVGATDSADNKASWSEYGNFIDITAPGVSVLTSNSGGSYSGCSGTSCSTPVAASMAAYIFSVYPSAKYSDVENAIYAGAKDLGTSGYDIYYGYGRADALGALQAMYTTPQDTTPPSVSINTPLNGQSVACTTTVQIGATDLNGISRVDFYVDGFLYATDTTGTNDIFEFVWDLQNYANGFHALKATAYDTSMNSKSHEITVSVAKDSSGPAIIITDPVDGSFTSSKQLQVTTSASSNTQQVDFYIDGVYKITDYSSPFTYTFSTGPYKGKTITITAIASNCNGLASQASSAVTLGGGSKGGGSTSTTQECSDSIDNDNDGFCDFSGCYLGKGKNRYFASPDPQCTSSSDTSE